MLLILSQQVAKKTSDTHLILLLKALLIKQNLWNPQLCKQGKKNIEKIIKENY